MKPFATSPEHPTIPTDSVRSIVRSHEFCQAYLHALDRADHTPAAQRSTARSILEAYFALEEIAFTAALNPDSVYFTENPVEVHGHYKFLIPGAVKRELIHGRLFLLTAKAAALKPSIDDNEFGAAIAAVEAVRLTLIPERVNGIISFVADAHKYYAAGNIAGAEQAMSTALDHMNRAAADGLRRIQSDAERGKRSNEVAGTRRTLANLRTKLQQE